MLLAYSSAHADAATGEARIAMKNRGVALQRTYYERTADSYDRYRDEDSEPHFRALRHVALYLDWLDATSVLDVGCGTGRALRYLGRLNPDLELRGSDPSSALLAQAERDGVPGEILDCSASDPLPYPDGAFDAAVATAVLHHVPDPERIIAEMLRVSRRAIFISDWNIYGAGSWAARLAKVALSRTKLLAPLNRLRRGGRDWYYSDGDGVAYSYSVFDSLPFVQRLCAQTILIPVDGAAGSIPMLQNSVCLLAGFRQPLPIS